MTIAWGVLLGAGVVLMVSPWLWPATPRSSRAPRTGHLVSLLREAGFARVGPGAVILTSVGSGAVLAAALLVFTHLPSLALIGMIAGVIAPYAYLRSRRDRRSRALQGQWPDVCDMLVASVRAGVSLPEAVSALADSGPDDLRPAFAAFRRDYAASGHFGSSVLRLKDQLADPTADRILESLRMARDVGGTALPSVLRSLSSAVRAETAVRGEAVARQSWIRGAAYVGVVAPWAILAMMLLRPDAAEAYATPSGMVLVVVAAVVSFVAFRLMLRIGALSRPRRWFG